MSQENEQVVARGFEHFRATGDFLPEVTSPDFVWDMSKFSGWPEQQVYPGIDGARRFMSDWIDAWDDWQWEIESLHSAADKVVCVLSQSGRSKTTGVRVDMRFAQVFTVRDGLLVRMEMYADPTEALEAAGVTG